jgi:hypothetical protein
VRPEKLDYFAPGPRRSAPKIAQIFSETATTGGRMGNKRKENPCDSVQNSRCIINAKLQGRDIKITLSRCCLG